MHPDSDAVLIRRFSEDGDNAAFEELVMRHLSSVRKFLAVRMGREFDIREAEQEVLVTLHVSLGKFGNRAAFTTYLYRICSNVSVDFVRRKARERNRTARLHLLKPDAEPRESDEPHGKVVRDESAREVREALDALGEPDRSILYLHDGEDLGIDEIASIFRLPSGTVKSKLSRGRDKMRKSLLAAGKGMEA